MTTPEDIHNKYDLRDLISRETGEKFERNAICCPFHNDTAPSFTVYEKNGVEKYYCHGCGEGGDIIDFVQKYRGLEFNDAKRYITGELENAPPPVERVSKKREEKPDILELHPAELPIKEPILALEKFNNYRRYSSFKPIFGTVEATYQYKDMRGNLLYIKCRLKGGKIQGKAVPFYFDGDKWRCKHPISEKRPLFRGHKIIGNNLPVLIPEGEKCAKVKVDGYNVVTWDGGSNGVKKSDWSILKGRKIVICPDNDDDGYKAAKEIAKITGGLIIDPSEYKGKEKGYDIADLERDKYDVSKIIKEEVIYELKKIAEEKKPTIDIDNIEPIKGNSVLGSLTPAKQINIKISQERRDYIESLLLKTKDGAVKPCMSNIYNITDNDDFLPKSIYKDVLTGDMHFYDGQSLESYVNDLMQYYARNFNIDLSREKKQDIVSYIALKNTFNSIISFFELIEAQYTEQEESPLYELFEYLCFKRHPEIKYEELSEAYIEIFDMFFARSLLQIVLSDKDRTFANRIVPILQGKQEIGKTTFVKFLAGNEMFFSGIDNESLDSGDRNTITKVKGKILCELEEITSIRRSKIERAKSFISNATYETRRLWSQQDTAIVKRTTSFVGTTNNAVFLKDETGNTRFFPILIDEIKDELYKQVDLPKKIYAWYFKKAKRIIKDYGFYNLRACPELKFKNETFEITERLRTESFEVDPLIEKIEKYFEDKNLQYDLRYTGISASEALEGMFKENPTAYNMLGFSKRLAEVARRKGLYKTQAEDAEGRIRNVWKKPPEKPEIKEIESGEVPF